MSTYFTENYTLYEDTYVLSEMNIHVDNPVFARHSIELHGNTDTISDADEDFDEDGLTNLDEYLNGTKPYNSDSDDDTLKDGDEVYLYGTNPQIRIHLIRICLMERYSSSSKLYSLLIHMMM